MSSKGCITLPVEQGMDDLLKEIADKWGADAVLNEFADKSLCEDGRRSIYL